MIVVSDEDSIEHRLNLYKLIARTGTSEALGEILTDPSHFIGGYAPIPQYVLQDEVQFLNLI